MTTPVLLAWSGGKDCLLALEALRRDPHWQVCALLTTVTARYRRVAMHGVRREVLHAQAAALGLPLLESWLEEPGDNAAYERAQTTALRLAAQRWPGVHHCAFGDLFLEDVRAYRQAQLARCGWQGVYPLWGMDTGRLARALLAEGHRAVVVCVDTTQLPAEFCGREYDTEFLDALPKHVDPCGERGEFHTLACGGPLFRAPLPLVRGESVLRDGRFQYTEFVLAKGGDVRRPPRARRVR